MKQKVRKHLSRGVKIKSGEREIETTYCVQRYDMFFEMWRTIYTAQRGYVSFKSSAERDEWLRIYLAVTKGKTKLVK